VPNTIYIVGAGPGSPDLLTLRAAALLRQAGVVLHDDLVPTEVLDLCPQSAQIVNVGKRCGRNGNSQEQINALMVWYASEAVERTIVRLKSGDPSVFGRLGEELEALRRADIPFEIVPGITAAAAAAAVAGFSLTDRRIASSLVIATGHRADGQALAFPGVDTRHSTFAIYMPGPDYARTAQELTGCGLGPDTPCALISNAGRQDEKTRFLTVGELASAKGIAAPALLIVGEVAREHSARRAIEDQPPAIEGTSVTSSPSLNL
jgi:uroporphyrin-III C-methyltransferase / precorrin-2 dehydrogenase / sirohydrochlorin ferrochelatase